VNPPAGFRYIDAHTHLHPEWLSRAIRRWFAEHSDWKLTYPTDPGAIVERRWAWERQLPLEVCRKIFNTNARVFLGLDREPAVA